MTNKELLDKIRNEILHLKMKELQRTNGINTGADVYLSSYAVLSILSNALTEESEDERIRKKIIDIVKAAPFDEEKDVLLDWLEKQKVNIEGDFGRGYDSGYQAGYAVAMNEMKPKVATATLDSEKQKEQKPTWSEEDENRLTAVVELLENTSAIHPNYSRRKLIIWLKSLRPQPKQEWSEEDETILDSVIHIITQYDDLAHEPTFAGPKWTHPYTKEIAWLKSLRPSWKPSEQEKGALRTAIHILTDERNFPKAAAQLQNILNAFEGEESRKDWKPSEEQMGAFRSYIKDFQDKAEAAVGGWNNFDVMIRLYEQLKKL